MLGQYNVTGELICLVLSSIILFLMIFTKPRRSYSYLANLLGIIVSIITIIFQYGMFYWVSTISRRRVIGMQWKIDVLCTICFSLYYIILVLIYCYVYLLSAERKLSKVNVLSYAAAGYVVYIAIAVVFLRSGRIYEIRDKGVVLINYMPFCATFGLILAVICIVVSIKNRRTIARMIFQYLMFFIMVEIILLIVQICIKDAFFLSMTYVFPFTIFYIVFHSNPYDEVGGWQNVFSMETRFLENKLFRKKYAIIYLSFPQFRNIDFMSESLKMRKEASMICKAVEAQSPRIFIYRINLYSFITFVERRDEDTNRMVVSKIEKVLKNSFLNWGFAVSFKMIAIYEPLRLQNMAMLQSFVRYIMQKKMSFSMTTQIYHSESIDFEDFNEFYQIEQMLLDIRNQMDVDDPRVQCFAQPIYSTKDQKYHSAEALMRLSLDGKIVYPEKFIKFAEKCNCIHSLTCIMLNKVCRAIRKMMDEYDFDAITVNCSTLELSDKHLYKELLEIIDRNRIPRNKIRIELTESAMFENFDHIMYNMEKLSQAGVAFYLDDFGTGYSNIDRIISCPFHTVKFDKNLLYKAIEDQEMESLIGSMVEVFKRKGFTVLIEGVENDKQNSFSIEHGFEYIQGFKYAKPVPIEQMTEYFIKRGTCK